MSRKKKGLSPEDRDLWHKVTEAADPLHPKQRAFPLPGHPKRKTKIKPDHTIAPFQLGERARATTLRHELAPTVSDAVRSAPLQMHQKTYAKMQRGKIKPEGKLDLHGMTLGDAHPEMTRFILDAHASGKRLVLIVTGKGKTRGDDGPIPIRRGVLRHQVPQWLGMPPLRAVVLQVTPAHISHGGEGAYYVYLRRAR